MIQPDLKKKKTKNIVQVPADRVPLRDLGLIGTGSDSGQGLSGNHRQQLSIVTARAGAGSETTGQPGKAGLLSSLACGGIGPVSQSCTRVKQDTGYKK